MFTGLIEDVGILESISRGDRQAELAIRTGLQTADFSLGESIAVNGVCLTVKAFTGNSFQADVSAETLEKSSLGKVGRGFRINLERALKLSDRLGGHLVTGHVDGLASLLERRQDGNAWRMSFALDGNLARLLVVKGSVAIDGISLTVNEVGADHFSVAVIPHTLAQTTLGELRSGDRVNIETDIIGKYVARLLGRDNATPGEGVSIELLAKYGYL
ncbi:MAG: riboflavin synthase [Desulfuromonas sp.]|nr:MAG: riboflavin synthase [Desulfuromonas sp.]